MKERSGFLVKKNYSHNVFLTVSDDQEEIVLKRVDNIRKRQKIQQFTAEVTATKQLIGTPGIVQFLDYSINGALNYGYIAFKHVPGQEMFRFMECRDFKPLPDVVLLNFVRQLIAALSTVHFHGFAHLDLKLENVIVSPEADTVTLIDFGLCKKCKTDELIGDWVGSPDYASPEILMHRKYSPFPADIYSLGILFYSMACGQNPFNTDDRNYSLLHKKKLPEIVWPKTYNCKAGRDALRRMIELDPTRRISLSKLKAHEWLNPKDLSP